MPLDSNTLRDAESAARAFLDAVGGLRDRHAKDENFRRMYGITGFKETAAVRRASMTLTRALADLRRGHP
jgi:hypothetical protein